MTTYDDAWVDQQVAIHKKMGALDEQILCGCGESTMRAVDAQFARVGALYVRDFVALGTVVALVCPTCSTVESGDDRL